jgi:hypothetical protein
MLCIDPKICSCLPAVLCCAAWQVAVELLKLSAEHGQESWANAMLNKKPYSIAGVSMLLWLLWSHQTPPSAGNLSFVWAAIGGPRSGTGAPQLTSVLL